MIDKSGLKGVLVKINSIMAEQHLSEAIRMEPL